jgi:hypothetical protein
MKSGFDVIISCYLCKYNADLINFSENFEPFVMQFKNFMYICTSFKYFIYEIRRKNVCKAHKIKHIE